MIDAGHVPERGDIVWIDFMPQADHCKTRHGKPDGVSAGMHDHAHIQN